MNIFKENDSNFITLYGFTKNGKLYSGNITFDIIGDYFSLPGYVYILVLLLENKKVKIINTCSDVRYN